MNNLPDEIKDVINSYVITCNIHSKYVYDKASYEYYKNREEYKLCSPMKVLNRNLCVHCDRDTIRYVRLVSYGQFL